MKNEIENTEKEFTRGDLVEVYLHTHASVVTLIGIVIEHIPYETTPPWFGYWSVLIGGKRYSVYDTEMARL